MAAWHADFMLGNWHVSPKLNRISRDGESVNIKHKSMAVLVFLADAKGDVVARNQIMDGVWPGMEVTDDVLTQSIVELRKAFHDDAKNPRIIETIPRVGFRSVARIEPVDEDVSSAQPTPVVARPYQRYWIAATAVAGLGVILWTTIGSDRDGRAPVISVHGSPSIAVLPFVNLSDDPENEYFAEGMSDEIRNLLGRIPELKIVGRTSSHAFKGQDEDLRTIGQKIGRIDGTRGFRT